VAGVPGFSDPPDITQIPARIQGTISAQLILFRYFQSTEEENPIRAFSVDENNLIVPFYPQFDLFLDAQKTGSDKSCYTGSVCQSGHVTRGRSLPPMTFFLRYFSDGEFHRGAGTGVRLLGTSSGQPPAASGKSPIGNRARRGLWDRGR
jgi:hypothetical protein